MSQQGRQKITLQKSQIWPFIFIPLILLIIFVLLQWRSVEQKIAHHAQTSLANTAFSWVNVVNYNRGRDILFVGKAPNQASVEEVKQHLKRVDGVRSVRFAGEVVTLKSPAKLAFDWQNGQLIISGELDSQETINAALNTLQAYVPVEKIQNNLSVNPNAGINQSIQAILGALSDKHSKTMILGDGDSLRINGNTLIIDGNVVDDQSKALLSAQLGQHFDGTITNLLVVDPPLKDNTCELMINDLLEKSKVEFESGNAIIREESFAILNKVTEISNRCAETKFTVTGHTDSSGNLQYNIRLSKQRAQAVVDYITEQGVSIDRVVALGVGPNEPIASNDTSAGRALNRRIEFKIDQNRGD